MLSIFGWLNAKPLLTLFLWGGGIFPYPQNLFSFDILGYFLSINPHGYVTISYPSSLLWLEEKNFGTRDINMMSSLK